MDPQGPDGYQVNPRKIGVSMPKFIPRAKRSQTYDSDSARVRLTCEDPSLAVQASKDEADINTIVKRFGLTGEIPITNRTPFPQDISFDEVLDYRTAWDRLLAAQASFNSLPANIRGTFANDPIAFADYAADPSNLDQLRTWGLAPKAPEPSPAPTPPA